ncbi:MAG: hypothetical protein IKV57_11380, partial [Clostridia bacterium]|nr:hypothetical protein [Clostridia bacterium]
MLQSRNKNYASKIGFLKIKYGLLNGRDTQLCIQTALQAVFFVVNSEFLINLQHFAGVQNGGAVQEQYIRL